MNGPLPETGGFLNSQLSFSKDALLATNYLDDYIVRGNVFNITLVQAFTAGTPIYFTSEYMGATDISLFLLPIKINPTEGYLILNIYEGSDYTGGTPVESVNRNRLSSKTADVDVNVGATGTTEGTLIQSIVYGVAGTNQSAGGGSDTAFESLILNTSTKYLFELTLSETATVGINAEFAEI